MARKTNKTAHVLSLISKAKDEHQSVDEQMQIDNTGSDVPNDLLFMGIEPSNDISISEKINENLQAFAAKDEPTVEAEPEIIQTNEPEIVQKGEPEIVQKGEPEIVQKGEPDLLQSNDNLQIDETPTPQRMPEANPTLAPNAEAEVAPAVQETKHTETEHVPAPSAQRKEEFLETPSEPVFHYVNVYERLVLERMDEFQTMFEVCTCPRCTADLIAIALTNLPAKYIVTDNSCTIPLLSFYREKYKTSVATQLSSACVKVKQSPSHS